MLDSGEACVPGTQKQPDMGEQEQRKATMLLRNLYHMKFPFNSHEPQTYRHKFDFVYAYRHMRHNDLWDVVHRLVYCPIAKVHI